LKFVILLRRITDGYTTFSEVYRYILDDSQIDRDIRRLKAALTDPPDAIIIASAEYRQHCIQKPWAHWFPEDTEHMAHPYEAELENFLAARKVVYEVRKPKGAGWAARKQQLEAVERWYVHGWSPLDRRLRSSIVEGVVVFLSLFDDSPAVHRAFCPPRSAYIEDPKPGEPKPLAPLESLLESGRVLALNFPVGLNPGLARILGVMLKLDFQRAILQRIPQITAHPERTWRDLLFVCDEYHTRSQPSAKRYPTGGDERTFAVARAVDSDRCRTSISSLRSALPGDELAPRVAPMLPHEDFLATSDRFTTAAPLRALPRTTRHAEGALQRFGIGPRPAYLAPHRPADVRYAIAEREPARAASRKYLSATHVPQLQNARSHRSAVDGISPLPPQCRCYLKPHYLPVEEKELLPIISAGAL
jgi:hypothetical protein